MHINTSYNEVKYVFNFVFDCLGKFDVRYVFNAVKNNKWSPVYQHIFMFSHSIVLNMYFLKMEICYLKLAVSYNKKKVDSVSFAQVRVVSTISGFLKNHLLFCLTQRSTWLGCVQHSDVTRLLNICLCALGGKSQPSLAPNAFYFTLPVVQNCL